MSKPYSASPLILGVIEDVDIYKIKQSPYCLRDSTNEITELALSIKEKGLLQPILIRTKDSSFEIVCGNRRYNACKSLGWRKVICHILELGDKEAFEISLIENIQRKTLDPMEEGEAFKSYVVNFGWGGISHLAAKIGKSVSHVQKRIKLLELPVEVLSLISDSSISTTVGEELLGLKSKEKQIDLMQVISKDRLSSRIVRQLVKDTNETTHHDYDASYSSVAEIADMDKKTQRSFDKSIIAIRIALNKIGSIIPEIEDNWIAYEILMQHRNMLHTEIDLLIKQKRKI